jgi:hypothetical protein
MNPNKLDDTKLDQIAKELGYSYRRGAKPGAGYIVIDAISGETPLGDDYTTPLKAVKEYFDTIAKQLKAKAKALGYSYVQDSEDRDAYVLTEDSTGDTLLVSETLKDIRAFLDSAASDLDVEVEITKLPKVAPPSPKDIADALRCHHAAKEIRAMAKSAKVEVKPTPDLQFEVRALKSREEFNPNWNDIGGHELNEHDEEDGGRDAREYLASVERQNKSFLAPEKDDAPDYSAPKAATGFVTTSINRRVKKSDISPKVRTLLTIETAIRAAQLKNDKAGIGKLLLEAKASTLDHGEFMKWAERATALTSRSCRNYMAMADQNGK